MQISPNQVDVGGCDGNEPELDRSCPSCQGARGRNIQGGWVRCSECQGRWIVPTAFGLKVLRFIRANPLDEE